MKYSLLKAADARRGAERGRGAGARAHETGIGGNKVEYWQHFTLGKATPLGTYILEISAPVCLNNNGYIFTSIFILNLPVTKRLVKPLANAP